MSKEIMPAILSCLGYELTDEEKYFFSRNNPLGINIFGRNIKNKDQLKKLIKEIKEVIGREDVLIAIDQEGGRVRRLREPEFESYAAAIDVGSLPLPEAKEAAKLHAKLIAEDLRELGINVDYAPVLDLIYDDTTSALKSRCFSSDEKIVAELGKEEVDAFISCGILPCIKHMPGHGRAQTDPHLGLPVLDQSLEELQKDFYPFKQLKDCPLGMTAHIVLSAVDDKLPITQSSKGIEEIIRKEIGFEGFLISDAIDMRALKGSAGERAAKALSAGCDGVCYALGDLAEMEEIAASVPPMSDKSLERFAKAAKIMHNNYYKNNRSEDISRYKKLTGNILPYQEDYDATEVLNRLRQK